MYSVIFFDALRVRIRSDGCVSNKAVYLTLGIQADGKRDVLGYGSAARRGQILAQGVQRSEHPRLPGILIGTAIHTAVSERAAGDEQQAFASAPFWRAAMNQFAILYGDRFTLTKNWRERLIV
jgi:transposase-like protein